ncbi:hypothetical protein FKM82_017450 [Ascaphus truei]
MIKNAGLAVDRRRRQLNGKFYGEYCCRIIFCVFFILTIQYQYWCDSKVKRFSCKQYHWLSGFYSTVLQILNYCIGGTLGACALEPS